MPSPGDELVDVVDDEGRIVRVVTRREMRAGRLPHRCVYLLVFNSRGELFVHLRTPIKDVNPSHWDVACGGVPAPGEEFDEAVRREGREELGVEMSPEPLFPFRYSDDRTTLHAMTYRVVHDGPFTLQPEEIVRGEFVPVEDIPGQRGPFCPDGLIVLAEYLKRRSDT